MNSPTGTFYTGMTSNLKRRVYEHKQKLKEGFTKKYNVTRLAYYEETSDVQTALAREKEIKKWRRSKKIALIGAEHDVVKVARSTGASNGTQGPHFDR